MREANIKSRDQRIPDTYSDTELMDTLTTMVKQGCIFTFSDMKASVIGTKLLVESADARTLLNQLNKERLERFL